MHSPRVTALPPPAYAARTPLPPSQGTSLCQDRFQERAISWPSTLPPPIDPPLGYRHQSCLGCRCTWSILSGERHPTSPPWLGRANTCRLAVHLASRYSPMSSMPDMVSPASFPEKR